MPWLPELVHANLQRAPGLRAWLREHFSFTRTLSSLQDLRDDIWAWYLVFNSSDRVWGMYVQGNNSYVSRTHCFKAFLSLTLSLSLVPAWCPMQKLHPSFPCQ